MIVVTAAFALPPSGGALTRTFSELPNQPTTRSCEEFGTTLTEIFTSANRHYRDVRI